MSLVHLGVKQEEREQWALEMSLASKGLPLRIFFGQMGLASYDLTVCQIIAICFGFGYCSVALHFLYLTDYKIRTNISHIDIHH